jgi:hypothetical protein
MQIAIIGTGRMARQLGLGWSHAGHTIIFGSREPHKHVTLAAQTKNSAVVDPTVALAQGDIVVLAIPYPAVAPFAKAYAHRLRGKLVIDISNPFDHLPDNRIAGAEITEQAIGPGARVVAAFKDNFAGTLLEPQAVEQPVVRDVHFAGDNPDDKQIVTLLVEDLGFRPVDCGPLKNARVLDVMVPLMLELDRRYGGGQGRSSWKFVV